MCPTPFQISLHSLKRHFRFYLFWTQNDRLVSQVTDFEVKALIVKWQEESAPESEDSDITPHFEWSGKMKSRFLFITISLGRCYSSLVQQDQRSKTDEELNNNKNVESTQSSKPAESDFEEIMAVDEEESESARLYQQQDKGNTIVPPSFHPRPIVPPSLQPKTIVPPLFLPRPTVPPYTQTNSGNSFQQGKMLSGRKKKLRSSETLKLSTSKRTPAYFSDDLKIGHVSTIARFPNQIVTESQTGALPWSPTISAKKMKNRFKYHTVLLYGLYICLPTALVLLFGLAFAAYYSPRREIVQVWMVHPFMNNCCYFLPKIHSNYSIRAFMGGSGRTWTQEKKNIWGILPGLYPGLFYLQAQY